MYTGAGHRQPSWQKKAKKRIIHARIGDRQCALSKRATFGGIDALRPSKPLNAGTADISEWKLSPF
jgi:hypothetical protein